MRHSCNKINIGINRFQWGHFDVLLKIHAVENEIKKIVCLAFVRSIIHSYERNENQIEMN